MQLHQQRQKKTFSIAGREVSLIKQWMLNWSEQFSIHVFFDNNSYPSSRPGYECLLAVGQERFVTGNSGELLAELQQLHDETKDWLFGHISYDYKNLLEPRLSSAHKPETGFPVLQFFVPHTVCYINREQTELSIESFSDPQAIYQEMMSCTSRQVSVIPGIEFSTSLTHGEYVQTIAALREHIAAGDCYEINFCNAGYCKDVVIDPLDVFNALNKLSPAPFACYYRLEDKFMMCASPERYLKKEGRKLFSQPIKGTARRDSDREKDKAIKEHLYYDIKERAENVMIVDLVRNDLARVSEVGSVQVDELFGIYTYPQVHHMISTISSTINEGASFTDAIRYSFPMGSMTGAPKHMVMQLIERYEKARRELFSGTVGYITPNGDFDFNVIIRSLFYNAATGYLGYQTGGAITYDSDPEKEWQEMRLKAWALERIFAKDL